MSEPSTIGRSTRAKSINDMIAQLGRIGEAAGEGSARYERAYSALRRYASNIKSTRRNMADIETITSLGINNGSRAEIARLNRAIFNRRYSRRTYAR